MQVLILQMSAAYGSGYVMHIKALHSQEIVVRAAQDPITHPPTGNMDETGIFLSSIPISTYFPLPCSDLTGQRGLSVGRWLRIATS